VGLSALPAKQHTSSKPMKPKKKRRDAAQCAARAARKEHLCGREDVDAPRGQPGDDDKSYERNLHDGETVDDHLSERHARACHGHGRQHDESGCEIEIEVFARRLAVCAWVPQEHEI